ncbi:hypothetical protein [Steroidobacter cummioxidans]|uniref:hypothetical protein n=1 Tax=Steroidobacter cummioxidans TaxID=1803913 RepID=UPI000E31F3A6|nr:hypothetical protein [Steroidobacter cummioxidans]
MTASLEAAVMATTGIAVAAILLMRIAGLSQRGLRVVMMSNPALLVVLLIAATGWWLAPAILIVVSSGQFSVNQYLETIFPVTYVFFPATALALRKYRGR